MASKPEVLSKVGKALQLPGGGINNHDVCRVIIAEDLFRQCSGAHADKLLEAVKRSAAKWAGPGMVATANLQAFISDAVPSLKLFGAGEEAGVLERAAEAARVMWWSEALTTQGQWMAQHAEQLDDELYQQLQQAQEISDEDVNNAKAVMKEMYEGFRVALDRTLILMPNTVGPATKINAHEDVRQQFDEFTLQLQSIATLMGAPQVVMPVPVAGHPPYSVALIGLHKTDMRLIQAATKFGPSLKQHMEATLNKTTTTATQDKKSSVKGSSSASSRPGHQSAAAQQQAESHKAAGNAAFKLGQFDVAISHYSKAIECQPQQAVYYSNRAMAYLKVMQFEEAKEDCNRALNIELNAKTLLRRGTARLGLNDVAGAESDFRQVLALEPNNRQARAELQHLKEMKMMMEGMP